MLTPREEIIWLSGILEGEGYFGLMGCGSPDAKAAGKKYLSPRIGVGMTDRDVIEHVGRLFGNTPTRHKGQDGNKDIYKVSVYGEKARWMMTQVRPYMGERRRAKIDEVMAHPAAYKRTPKPWPFFEQLSADFLEPQRRVIREAAADFAQSFALEAGSDLAPGSARSDRLQTL